jgi:hypothetical protein
MQSDIFYHVEGLTTIIHACNAMRVESLEGVCELIGLKRTKITKRAFASMTQR